MRSFFLRLKHSRAVGFACFVYHQFNKIDIMQTAGSLTFATLLALVPLLVVLLVAVSMFPWFADAADAFMRFISHILMPSGVSAVADYLNRFQTQAAQLGTVGTAAMAVTSLMLVHSIESTFNRIWRVQRQRSWTVRLPMHIVLLLLVPAVVGLSVTLSGNLMLFGSGQSDSWFSGSLQVLHQFVLYAFALTLVFRATPNCHVPLRHAFLGACITALFLEIAKWSFGVYLRHFHSYELVYGAFAIIPIFLVWLHLLWTIVLCGALFTACCNYWQGDAFRRARTAHTLLDDMVAMLLLLARADGRPLTLRDFRQINIGYERAEKLLSRLEAHGYVRYARAGWLLDAPPDTVWLDSLFRLFVYDAGSNGNQSAALDKVMAQSTSALHISLSQLLEEQAA